MGLPPGAPSHAMHVRLQRGRLGFIPRHARRVRLSNRHLIAAFWRAGGEAGRAWGSLPIPQLREEPRAPDGALRTIRDSRHLPRFASTPRHVRPPNRPTPQASGKPYHISYHIEHHISYIISYHMISDHIISYHRIISYIISYIISHHISYIIYHIIYHIIYQIILYIISYII